MNTFRFKLLFDDFASFHLFFYHQEQIIAYVVFLHHDYLPVISVFIKN